MSDGMDEYMPLYTAEYLCRYGFSFHQSPGRQPLRCDCEHLREGVTPVVMVRVVA
jgi:hypothetical protein